MSDKDVILGRQEHGGITDFQVFLSGMHSHKVLITGAGGSIGQRLGSVLGNGGVEVVKTDIISAMADGVIEMDVTDGRQVSQVLGKYNPTHIVHLAAQKDAPTGELEQSRTQSINILGTKNIVSNSRNKIRVVFASTCKACDPVTVYGDTKRIGEEIVIENGGVVARFFNVFPSSANVFHQWGRVPPNESIKAVKSCFRYFISLDEAVGLLLFSLLQKQGTYRVGGVIQRNMFQLATQLYSFRTVEDMHPRIGDRLVEPLEGNNEISQQTSVSNILKILKNSEPKS